MQIGILDVRSTRLSLWLGATVEKPVGPYIRILLPSGLFLFWEVDPKALPNVGRPA